jgi:NADH-quinone oxidoreductase subunit F
MKCEVRADLLPDAQEIAEPREGVCPVDWALRCVKTAQQENCGISVMCRDGMAQLAVLIADVVSGKGQQDDLSTIADLCGVIAQGGCEIAEKAARNVLFALEKYPDEWDQHCRRKRCAELVCPAYYSVYIDPALCTGCGECAKMAPKSVDGGEGLVHVVSGDDAAVKTDAFFACCPVSAIKKAGSVKPRLPESPVPVGTFGADDGERRRRRR